MKKKILVASLASELLSSCQGSLKDSVTLVNDETKRDFSKLGGEFNQAPGVVEQYKRESPKVGRNESCPCGSGKKFKKCCI